MGPILDHIKGVLLGRSNRMNRGEKELDQIQKMRREIEKLKRENVALRKQMARIDFTRFQNLRELVNKQRKEDLQERKEATAEKLKKEFLCYKCGKDWLRLKLWDHPIKGPSYYRACPTPGCGHRTEMKPYTPKVRGITEEGEIKDGKTEEGEQK